MAKIAITDEDFRKFREFFYRKTGIQFENSKRYFVDKRLIDRIEFTKTHNFRDYFYLVRFQESGEELQQLTNCMTVNETYFFREDYQFKCLVQSILPEIVKNKPAGSVIKIWSIPSSSGEEAYSIAMYLMEYWSGINDWDVELISSDIDTNMLNKAKIGKYQPRSVQNLPKELLNKYFLKSNDGCYQICDELRQSVEFTRVNLNDNNDTRSYRDIDVIFCRNLLIYFDDVSRRRAAEEFYDSLALNGFICLGHSESMSRISSLFKVRKFPHAIIYQKSEER